MTVHFAASLDEKLVLTVPVLELEMKFLRELAYHVDDSTLSGREQKFFSLFVGHS